VVMTQQYKFMNIIYKNWCSCSNWMQQSVTRDKLWSVGNKYQVFQNLSSLSRAHVLFNAHTQIQLALGACCICTRSSISRTVGRIGCPMSFHVFQRSAAELPAIGESKHEVRNYSQVNQQSFEFKWEQPPLRLYKHLSTNLKDPTFRLIPAIFPHVTYTYFSKFSNFSFVQSHSQCIMKLVMKFWY